MGQFDFRYDQAHRIEGKTGQGHAWQYAYDDNGRLTTASSHTVHQYTLDSLGNRTGSGEQYSPFNQLQSDNQYDYEYDLRGNLVEKVDRTTGERWEFTWDGFDRLSQVRHSYYFFAIGNHSGNGELRDSIISYSYDALGQRMEL